MSTDRNRRKVLKMLPALAIAGPSRALGNTPVIDDRRLAAAVLDVFAQPDTARLMGSTYLKQRPHEAAFSSLMAHLKADLDLLGWYRGGAGKPELHNRLQARAAIDYNNDEGVEVAGCYLSVTELRVFALSTFV
ncbi:MAG: hypothetical protein O3C34_15690 [Proteobacteria bacterium]|nr:hypothetical protein [Pseudomonadota bacterium]